MSDEKLYELDADLREFAIQYYDRYVQEAMERGTKIHDFNFWFRTLVLRGLIEYDNQLEDIDNKDIREQAYDFLYRIAASQNSTLSIKAKRELATVIAKQIQESKILSRLQYMIEP